MKNIRQLSTEFGISKEAIYKKLKFQLKEQLAEHIVKVDNVTHLDEEGELIIRQSLNRERREAIETLMGGVVEDGAFSEALEGQAHLTEYVTLLKEQVKAKDIQIEAQSGHIGQLIRQLGITQLLPHNRRLPEPMSEPVPQPVSSRGKQTAPARKTAPGRHILGRLFGRGRKAVQ